MKDHYRAGDGLHRLLIAMVILVVAGCSEPTYAPLTGERTGLTALRWGMPPDSAIAHMTDMQGVTLISDSLVLPRKTWTYHSPESVRVYAVGRYPVRVYRFSGGSFFGYPVSSWELGFRDDDRLEQVDIAATSHRDYRTEFSALTEHLAGLYGQVTARWQIFKSGGPPLDPFLYGRKGQFVTLGWSDSVDRMDYLKATSIVEVTTWERSVDDNSSDVVFRYYDRALRDERDDLLYEDPAFFRPEIVHISEVDTASIRPHDPSIE